MLGFSKTAKCTLKIDELEKLVAAETYPIVYVNLFPIESKRIVHALIVLKLTAELVTVYDPEQGERAITRDLFIEAWKRQHYLAIIVQK